MSGDEGYGIAVDGFGNAYVTGETGRKNFPTTQNAFQSTFNGPLKKGDHTSDSFVAKIGSSGVIAAATAIRGSLPPAFGNAVVVSPRGVQSNSVEASVSTGHRHGHPAEAAGPIRRHHAQAADVPAMRLVEQAIAGPVTHERIPRSGLRHDLDLGRDPLADLALAR